MRATEALEAQLTAEETRGLAAKLDAILQTRAAAVGMAAGGLDIEHLGARGGLERLLNHLNELFPDFLSLEVLNEQGQALAMMGDLSLSQAGRKPKLDSAAEAAAAGQPGTVGFQDDPRHQRFCLTLRHGGSDAVTWYSRTSFSRKPIDLAIAPSDTEKHVTLQSGLPGKGTAMGRWSPALAMNVEKGWLGSTFHAEIPLAVPGWKVTVQRVGKRAGFGLLAPIVPFLMLLVAGAALWLVRQPDATGSPWSDTRKHDVPSALDPLPSAEPVSLGDQPIDPWAVQFEQETAQCGPDPAPPETEPDRFRDELFASAPRPSPGFEDESKSGQADFESEAVCEPMVCMATPADVDPPPVLDPSLQPATEMDIPDTLDIEWIETAASAKELGGSASDICSASDNEGSLSSIVPLPEAVEVAWVEAESDAEKPKKPSRRTKRTTIPHQTGISA
ncbi:MAG: hypothetical protein HY914_07290 [Desulfomonile tiedjei]|nr:hypothetical protein [Desulfomonile tiedjei]